MKKNLDVILNAYNGGYAIAHFNINNLEWAKYILEVCEEEKSPVILGVSTGAAKYMGGYYVVSSFVHGLIKDLNISVPVILHLDHAHTFLDCKMASLAGFDSLMMDASRLDMEENIKATKDVLLMAPQCIIEGEIGLIGGSEDGDESLLVYTTGSQALEYVNGVKVDILAAALGSVHGIYHGEAKINFEAMREISSSTNVPLVLHGGSGLSDEILRKSISCGVAKINFNTELQIAWSDGVKKYIHDNPLVYDPRKIIGSGENALKDVVRHYILVLGSNNKG